ncbi:MAG: sigma-54 dependent transcriptional regulator [Hydrogenophaga sp.]|jgi:DNA-binding NtrC family response regulator|nr:sigma-54 dependent transcriptional regulator [Hydrogenophaga sp.]
MNYSVLVIEDEPILARNIQTYLTRFGVDCHLAESAESGLGVFERERPDVVVLDHNLPGRTGLSLLQELRKREPGLPVILATGHGSETIAVEAMKAGAFDYLIKPISLHQLRQVMDRAVQQLRQASELRHLRAKGGHPAWPDQGLQRLLGDSSAMQRLRQRLEQIGEAELRQQDGAPMSVLIVGETGTGKELVARALHFGGQRAAGPFVEVNCAALPSHLVESELFGHERGAFTDARERHVGLVESAHGGTLFLDEVTELELATQAKLLKLIEDRRLRRLGSTREIAVDVRILAATNRRVDEAVREGRFRADLYYRLRGLQVELPPLRDRGGDVLQLAAHFLALALKRYGRSELSLSDEARNSLQGYRWPGNVRELAHVIEQAVILSAGTRIEASDLLLPVMPDRHLANALDLESGIQLPDMERRLLQQALDRNGWNITQAARALGISRDTLRYRIEKFGLRS